MAQKEEIMFQNVAYWPTVYRTGGKVDRPPKAHRKKLRALFLKRHHSIPAQFTKYRFCNYPVTFLYQSTIL